MNKRILYLSLLTILANTVSISQGWQFVGPDSINWQGVQRVSGKWFSPNSFRLAAVTYNGIAVFPTANRWNYDMQNWEGNEWFPGYEYTYYEFSPWENDSVYLGYADYYIEPAFGISKTTFPTGVRWRRFPAGCWTTPFSVVFSRSDSIAYVTVCGLHRSTDQGITWNQIEGSTSFYFSKLLGVNSRTGREIYNAVGSFGTNNNLLRSTNSGVTWDSLLAVTASYPTYLNDSPLSLWAHGDTILVGVKSTIFDTSQSIGVFRSTNNGASWAHTYTQHRVYGIVASEVSANLLFVASEAGILKSTDFGGAWTPYNNALPTSRLTSIIISPYSDTMFVSTETHGVLKVWNYLTGVGEKAELPNGFELLQNYPNPFNPETKIGFRIQESGFVSLKVFDVLGREVATLVNEVKQPGNHSMQFDAGNLSSGVYFYQLKVNDLVQSKKMILAR